MVNVLAIPVVVGRKTARERFAGATNTMTCELMTGDGKALQMGTSHELGQNFARAFDINFLAPSGEREFAWQTSWGSSTRMVGGLIMAHGDDEGLRVPPRLAPTQVAVIVVKAEATEAAAAAERRAQLGGDPGRAGRPGRRPVRPAGRRLRAQGRPAAGRGRPARPGRGPGHAGPPARRRQDADAAGRRARRRAGRLVEDQAALYAEAERARDARIVDVKTVDDAVEAAATGWARLPWSGSATRARPGWPSGR